MGVARRKVWLLQLLDRTRLVSAHFVRNLWSQCCISCSVTWLWANSFTYAFLFCKSVWKTNSSHHTWVPLRRIFLQYVVMYTQFLAFSDMYLFHPFAWVHFFFFCPKVLCISVCHCKLISSYVAAISTQLFLWPVPLKKFSTVESSQATALRLKSQRHL